MMTVNMLLLSLYGIKPDEAQNGKIAVEMFQNAMQKSCKCPNRAYKLILMDIQMPLMDGHEATDAIMKLTKKEAEERIQPRNSRGEVIDFCNIIAITSYTSEVIKKKCLSQGMRAVLHKPVSKQLLK
jgi:CheY-like chemotaxis protein